MCTVSKNQEAYGQWALNISMPQFPHDKLKIMVSTLRHSQGWHEAHMGHIWRIFLKSKKNKKKQQKKKTQKTLGS